MKNGTYELLGHFQLKNMETPKENQILIGKNSYDFRFLARLKKVSISCYLKTNKGNQQMEPEISRKVKFLQTLDFILQALSVFSQVCGILEE